MCNQKQLLKRTNVEHNFLVGIKSQLLDPTVIKEITRRIQAETRKNSPRSATDIERKLKELDRQINDLAETICEVGRSDIVTAKLKELEAERRSLNAQVSSVASAAKLLPGATDKWREIVVDLENPNKVAQPDEMDTARRALRDIIGEVTVVEEDTGVIAYAKLSNDAVYKHGAENAAPELKPKLIELR